MVKNIDFSKKKEIKFDNKFDGVIQKNINRIVHI